MNVLVIPEDFRKDQYILQPIIRALFRALGRAQATVIVCRDPLLAGISEALNRANVESILRRYRGMVDVFILCVDRDGDANRREALTDMETFASEILEGSRIFVAEHAWQELEVWPLAAFRLHLPWSRVRAEVNPKEEYFIPYARSRGLLTEPGQGRRTLGREAAGRYARIRQLCPEDVRRLEDRLRNLLG